LSPLSSPPRAVRSQLARVPAKYLATHTNGPRDLPRTCPGVGFELTTKAATLQGGSEDFTSNLKVKFWDLVTAWWWCLVVPAYPIEYLENDPANIWSLNAAWLAILGQCAPSPQACRHAPAPGRATGGPRRVFFRRKRQRYKHASGVG
jgi:hypothetical protein